MNFIDYNCGIYKITSPSGRIYIGQTINAKKRHNSYKNLDISCKNQSKLYLSLQKYGYEAHKVEWLVVIDDRDQLNILETFFIRKFNSMNDGLNCTEGGDSRIWSEESKQKLSQLKKGIKRKSYSKETRKKIGDFHRGRKRSKETIEKMRKAQQNRHLKKLDPNTDNLIS